MIIPILLYKCESQLNICTVAHLNPISENNKKRLPAFGKLTSTIALTNLQNAYLHQNTYRPQKRLPAFGKLTLFFGKHYLQINAYLLTCLPHIPWPQTIVMPKTQPHLRFFFFFHNMHVHVHNMHVHTSPCTCILCTCICMNDSWEKNAVGHSASFCFMFFF